MAFNRLDDGEAERLALLLEELGEAQQAIGKILRHGYESYNPDLSTDTERGPSNRMMLETELGDVMAAMMIMEDAQDLNPLSISVRIGTKRKKVGKYLHHQGPAIL